MSNGSELDFCELDVLVTFLVENFDDLHRHANEFEHYSAKEVRVIIEKLRNQLLELVDEQ